MTSYNKVAKMYGVTKMAVFLWCKKHQLPADEYRPSPVRRGKDPDPNSCNQVSIRLNANNEIVAKTCKSLGLSLSDFERYKTRARQLHSTIPSLVAYCRDHSVEPEDVDQNPRFIKRIIIPALKRHISCRKAAALLGVSHQRVSQICIKRGVTPAQLVAEHKEKSEL